MLFDGVAPLANGAVHKTQLPPQAAAGIRSPCRGSISVPSGGVTFSKGVVIAASTTGKTLSADAATSGNSFFRAGY